MLLQHLLTHNKNTIVSCERHQFNYMLNGPMKSGHARGKRGRLVTVIIVNLFTCCSVFLFRSKLGLFQSRISLQKASVKVRDLFTKTQNHHLLQIQHSQEKCCNQNKKDSFLFVQILKGGFIYST